MPNSKIELKPSLNEKFDIIPSEMHAQNHTTEIPQLASTDNMPDSQSLLLHSTHTESTLVKNDFFRMSYPSLNVVINHVDSVINKITPVTFEPPSYLDESLRKSTSAEKDPNNRIPHGLASMSNSFFVSICSLNFLNYMGRYLIYYVHKARNSPKNVSLSFRHTKMTSTQQCYHRSQRHY